MAVGKLYEKIHGVVGGKKILGDSEKLEGLTRMNPSYGKNLILKE